MYVAELAPARIRGKLACFGLVTITGSIFLAALVSGIFSGDKTSGWRFSILFEMTGLFIQFHTELRQEQASKYNIKDNY